MKRVWHTPAAVLAGLVVTALCATPQNNTISARPGAVNYIEGTVSVNGAPLDGRAAKGKTFLGPNDTLMTEQGKAEVLLTPGVFLRVDANSEIKMVSPSLTLTQVEVSRGDALVEVDQLLKENDIQVIVHNTPVELKKIGLYRFSTQPALEQTLDGKAEITENGHSVGIGKNHQVDLTDPVKATHIEDNPEHSDLYAWSKVRDEYVAAASYSSAQSVVDVPGGGWGWAPGFGFGSGYGYGFGYGGYGSGFGYGPGLWGAGFGPGWAWNPYWNSFAWLPGSGAFYSPFGYGFYAPTVVAYAPVVVAPVNGKPVTVPVNPSKPGVGGHGTNMPIQPATSVASFRPGTIAARAVGPARAAAASGGSGHASGGGFSGSGVAHVSSASMGHASGGGGGSHR